MTIRKITVNGNEYEFINESRSTRHGFAHDTTLFKGYYSIGKATCHYLNRTWECYRYQTVMQRCISNIIDSEYEDFIADYKAERNIKRLTAEKRAEADRDFEALAEIKELREVYKQLDNSN
jgi:hypothetical protein